MNIQYSGYIYKEWFPLQIFASIAFLARRRTWSIGSFHLGSDAKCASFLFHTNYRFHLQSSGAFNFKLVSEKIIIVNRWRLIASDYKTTYAKSKVFAVCAGIAC